VEGVGLVSQGECADTRRRDINARAVLEQRLEQSARPTARSLRLLARSLALSFLLFLLFLRRRRRRRPKENVPPLRHLEQRRDTCSNNGDSTARQHHRQSVVQSAVENRPQDLSTVSREESARSQLGPAGHGL